MSAPYNPEYDTTKDVQLQQRQQQEPPQAQAGPQQQGVPIVQAYTMQPPQQQQPQYQQQPPQYQQPQQVYQQHPQQGVVGAVIHQQPQIVVMRGHPTCGRCGHTGPALRESAGPGCKAWAFCFLIFLVFWPLCWGKTKTQNPSKLLLSAVSLASPFGL